MQPLNRVRTESSVEVTRFTHYANTLFKHDSQCYTVLESVWPVQYVVCKVEGGLWFYGVDCWLYWGSVVWTKGRLVGGQVDGWEWQDGFVGLGQVERLRDDGGES